MKIRALKAVGRVIFALLFVGACVFHFIEAQGFANMLPDFVPYRLFIIYATAILEFALAVLLLIPSTSRRTGVWTAIYLVLIFPANIYAAIFHIPAPGSDYTSPVALWVRLIFQPLLIWWVLWCTRERGTKNS